MVNYSHIDWVNMTTLTLEKFGEGGGNLTEKDFARAVERLQRAKEKHFPTKTPSQKAALKFASKDGRSFSLATKKDGKYYAVSQDGQVLDEVLFEGEDVLSTSLHWCDTAFHYVTVVTFEDPEFKILDAVVLYPSA